MEFGQIIGLVDITRKQAECKVTPLRITCGKHESALASADYKRTRTARNEARIDQVACIMPYLSSSLTNKARRRKKKIYRNDLTWKYGIKRAHFHPIKASGDPCGKPCEVPPSLWSGDVSHDQSHGPPQGIAMVGVCSLKV